MKEPDARNNPGARDASPSEIPQDEDKGYTLDRNTRSLDLQGAARRQTCPRQGLPPSVWPAVALWA